MEYQGMKESNCEETKLPHLESAAKIITEFGTPVRLYQLIDGSRYIFDQYLHAVDEIQHSIKSGMISDYENQGICALNTLQSAFRGILYCSINLMSKALYSSSMSGSSGYELQVCNYTGSHGELSLENVYRLCSIVKRLNSGECLGDCVEMYTSSRKMVVFTRYLRFGIHDLQCWDHKEFAAKITLWIHAANTFYNTIFPAERQYYEQVFAGVNAVTYDNCFLAIIEPVATMLNHRLHLRSTISFQNLFSVLDLYMALSVILPEIKNMFNTVSYACISDEASKSFNRLKTLVSKLFSRFQDAVLNESSKTLSPIGGIYYMTDYTMNFVITVQGSANKYNCISANSEVRR